VATIIIGMTGDDDYSSHSQRGECVMRFEIPKHFNAETRSMIEAALEEAWQELSRGTRVEATATKRRLVRTMVALAAVGENRPQ
jgi:hypothetical protein